MQNSADLLYVSNVIIIVFNAYLLLHLPRRQTDRVNAMFYFLFPRAHSVFFIFNGVFSSYIAFCYTLVVKKDLLVNCRANLIIKHLYFPSGIRF